MRHLPKPQFDVEEIVKDCAQSYRAEDKRKRFNNNAVYIKQKSIEYDACASQHDWLGITKESIVNGEITPEEMAELYQNKFVKHASEREKYYDKIMSLAVSGKCPICGIGQVSTLDHYLAKSLYPTYTVTPVNLIPVCKDCNFNKLDFELTSNCDALLHPYYDQIDDFIWLCAEIKKEEGSIVARYFVNPNIDNELYVRLKNHFEIYDLGQAYAVQAATEIAENVLLWKNKYIELGKESLIAL